VSEVFEGEVPAGPSSIRGDETFSLLNFVADAVREAVLRLPEEYLIMTENQLKKEAKPTRTDYALRVSFWREFDKIFWRDGKRKIVSLHVYAGICTDTYFYDRFLKNPRKVAWLVRPQQTYAKEMEAILARVTERLWEIVDIPIRDRKGNVSSRNADILLRAAQMIENRVKGMAIQRIEEKSLRLNVTAKPGPQTIETVEAMEAKIRVLEAELGPHEAANRVDVVIADHPALPPAREGEREIVGLPAVRVAIPVER
jgi:hypothetical protein